MNIDLLSKTSRLVICVILLHCIMKLLATATPIIIDSATLIDHIFHNHFFDNLARDILNARSTDRCYFREIANLL